MPPDATINLADALVAPDVLRPHLVNWIEVVGYFIRSVEADAAADGTAETAALLKRLLAHEGVQAAVNAPPVDFAIAPVLPMHFRKGATDLRLFTTIATLGIPQDRSRCRNFALRVFFQWMKRPPVCCAEWMVGPAPGSEMEHLCALGADCGFR